jgi:hypothetical protein
VRTGVGVAKAMKEKIDKAIASLRWDLGEDTRLEALSLLLADYIERGEHDNTEGDSGWTQE